MAEVTHPNDAELEPGQRVGEYVISHRLGKGGFGAVYAAQQPVIHKVVAIKVIAWRFASDREMISRFIAEARLVNEIRHHNIIDIFSFGCLPDGRHYYVMELLDGVTLDRRIADRRPLAMDEALTILRGIARALDAAHARGVVHRDLKPDNVFLLRDGTSWFPKLLDFGIAKLLDADTGIEHKTVSGIAVGTPTYMPPEQCRGQRVDHRADVYSLGVLAYRLLTGHLPFVASNAHDLVRMHVEVVPPLASARNPELDAHADRAIAAMLEKDPARRPGSASAAIEALAGGRGSQPHYPMPTPVPTPEPDPSAEHGPMAHANTLHGRTPRKYWLVVGACSIALGVAIAFAVTRNSPEAEPTVAAKAPAPAAIPQAPPPPPRPEPAPEPEPIDARAMTVADAMPADAPPDAPIDAAPAPHVIQISGAPRGAILYVDSVAATSWTVEIADDRTHEALVTAPGWEDLTIDLRRTTKSPMRIKLRKKVRRPITPTSPQPIPL